MADKNETKVEGISVDELEILDAVAVLFRAIIGNPTMEPTTLTDEKILEIKQYYDSELVRYWRLSKPYPPELLAGKAAFERAVNDGFCDLGKQFTIDGKEVEDARTSSN